MKSGAGVLDDGGRISATRVRRLACEAGIIPAVRGGRSQPLAVGRKKRFHTTAQRIALALRDGGCTAGAVTTRPSSVTRTTTSPGRTTAAPTSPTAGCSAPPPCPGPQQALPDHPPGHRQAPLHRADVTRGGSRLPWTRPQRLAALALAGRAGRGPRPVRWLRLDTGGARSGRWWSRGWSRLDPLLELREIARHLGASLPTHDQRYQHLADSVSLEVDGDREP